MRNMKLSNWAGNLEYGAARIHYPGSVEEVRRVVQGAGKVKGLGTRHSFNDVGDCEGDLVCLARLDRVIGIDRERGTVTVEGGAKYGEVGEYLNRRGFALGNMASLPHISVAGACATATHGSGDGNGNLATAVVGMEIVKGDGEVIEVSRERDGEQFEGLVVNLGGLGIVTKVTLRIEPAFLVRQDVYERLPWERVWEDYDGITGSAYSVSLFTDWGRESVNQVWVKRRIADGERSEAAGAYFGAKLAAVERHPSGDRSSENCTQRGVAGPWHERLPHFRMEFTPSCGEELQSEYFVPRENAKAAFEAVLRLREKIAGLLIVSELRTVAEDGLWLSPCFGRASAAIHFTWKRDWEGVSGVLPEIEAGLEGLGARPHWGKMFRFGGGRVAGMYERAGDFRKLMREIDPTGKFRNGFLERYVCND